MEVYTSWVLCRVRHTLRASGTTACATAHSLREGGSFTDSRPYIQALSSRRPAELGEGLGDLLLSDCIRLASRFPLPQHLYRHQQGTFLDSVLHDVDEAAKAQALRQPHPVPAGYIAGLHDPQPAFSRDGVQWHDASTVQYRPLCRLYPQQQLVEYALEVASYAYYATCVASGSLSWGGHLRMVTFRHGLSTATLTRCAFCDTVLTATHFQEDCRYSRLWSAVLYTQMASDLRRIIPEWSVSLPTCWGVLVQWGGMYLGGTSENAAVCPVPHVSWITLSHTGRVLPASEKAMVQHGATPQQVRRFLLAFWRAVLRMSSTTHPPQLCNEGDGARPGHTRQAFDYLSPDHDFPATAHWHLQPPESSPVPPALHLQLLHNISGVSIYVLDRSMAHAGTGKVLYWFHSRPRLAEYTQWPRFVRQRTVLCSEAARELEHCQRWFVLRYGAGPHRFLAGYTHNDCTPTPAGARRWWNMWRFCIQTCGHAVHSHYTDLRSRMTSGC